MLEETKVDKVEVVGDFKHVQIRMARVIYDNDVEISRNFHRCAIAPGGDCSEQNAEVQAICALVHTPEVIAAYEAHVASQEV